MPRKSSNPAARKSQTPKSASAAKKPSVAAESQTPKPTPPSPAKSSVTAEAALSFLKDMKSVLTWSARDLADTLNISRADAEQAIALLEAQGYAKRHDREDAWITTPAGMSVSGAKQPRFTPENVKQALDSLAERIKDVNKNTAARFRISDAVAFGDFLLRDRARVQAADAGIALARREDKPGPRSFSEAREEREFLRELRAKSAMLHLRPYAGWMRQRTHRALL